MSVIYFKEKGREQETLFVDYEFMITEFLKHIYHRYQNSWDYIERFDLRQERRLFGKLMNTEETKSKIGRQLVANDFDLNISFNCIIRCEMWLKSDDRPTIYRITKKELLQTFVKDTYDLHGNDWYCFETFFDDTRLRRK